MAAAIVLLGLLSACAENPAAPVTADSASPSSRSPATSDWASAEPSTSASASARPTRQPTRRPTGKPTRAGKKVIAAGSDFGTILFDGTGQPIYLFDVEPTSEPRCYGACSAAWPPVLTAGEVIAGEGVQPSLLGTTPRADGTTQVTYGGHPLYFYAHEGKYEVTCHGVFLNGGNWYAVRPDGHPAS